MTYTVTTTSGAALAVISDSTVNKTATSLTLIGKNYAGYGIFLNENYVKLLENFANATSPTSPLAGQLWYNTIDKVLNFYDGVAWKPLSAAQSTSVAPEAETTKVGDIWWDINVSQLKAWDGTQWIVIGPILYTPATVTTGAVSMTISDGFVDHYVVALKSQDTIVAIVSNDSQFTPNPSVSGFSSISPGVNLRSGNVKYVGTSITAETLGTSVEGDFLRKDGNDTTLYTLTVNELAINDKFKIDADTSRSRLINQFPSADFEIWVGSSTKAIDIDPSGVITLAQPLPVTSGGTGSTTASGARTNLGLGTLSTQNTTNLVVTGGSLTGVSLVNASLTNATLNSLTTPITIAQGGTGATSVNQAKINLGLNNVTNESKTTMFGSPTFTGVATAVTMPTTSANTAIATTAFVNNYFSSYGGFGISQSWQGVTGSRSFGDTYQNTTNKPIMVYVRYSAYWATAYAYIGNSTSAVTTEVASDSSGWGWYYWYNNNNSGGINFIVPSGKYYKVICNGVKQVWNELR